MDKISFAKTLTALRLLYPAKVDAGTWEAMIEAYWLVLGDIPDQALAAAMHASVRKHPSFFPTAGELLAIADLEPSNDGRASEAWEIVRSLAMRSSSDHPDPCAAEVMRLMGGGRFFGGLSDRELGFARKEFIALYVDIVDRYKTPRLASLANGGGSGLLNSMQVIKAK